MLKSVTFFLNANIVVFSTSNRWVLEFDDSVNFQSTGESMNSIAFVKDGFSVAQSSILLCLPSKHFFLFFVTTSHVIFLANHCQIGFQIKPFSSDWTVD